MKMKISKTAFIVLVALLFTYTDGLTEDRNKKIVGKWYNPRTYKLNGEMKGFQFKRNGKCKALGIETLHLDSWQIKEGKLFVEGKRFSEEKGEWERYNTVERIEKLTRDSLYLLISESPFKMGFLYVSPKTLKKELKQPSLPGKK